MIGDSELYRAVHDSISVTEETESDGAAALRAAGLDPISTIRAAGQIVSTYPQHIERLQAEGMSYRDALKTVLTTSWIEGATAGARATRSYLTAVEDA